MYQYRITKYDPSLRDETGAYRGDDWTSVSDIGKEFAGELLTVERYLQIEDGYVAAIRAATGASASDAFSVRGLENTGELEPESLPPDGQLQVVARDVREGDPVLGDRLSAVVRANLREQLWCRLEHADGRFVHFGQDFYVYVGTRERITSEAMPSGIFAELCDSPIGQ